MFLEISQNSQENTCARVFFNKVAGHLQLYLKRGSDTGVSCEFCKISNNTFVTGHLWTTASIVFDDYCTISHSYIIFNDELFDIKRLLQRARYLISLIDNQIKKVLNKPRKTKY